MNVFDTNGSMDSAKFLEYIVNQFPGDLKSMVEARNELAKRQGAISAVDAANSDRAAAKLLLDNATEEAKAMVANTKAKNAAATSKLQELDAREAVLNARSKDMDTELNARADVLSQREKRNATIEASLSALQLSLDERAMKIDSDRSALDARVKAFQDKVAALSA